MHAGNAPTECVRMRDSNSLTWDRVLSCHQGVLTPAYGPVPATATSRTDQLPAPCHKVAAGSRCELSFEVHRRNSPCLTLTAWASWPCSQTGSRCTGSHQEVSHPHPLPTTQDQVPVHSASGLNSAPAVQHTALSLADSSNDTCSLTG